MQTEYAGSKNGARALANGGGRSAALGWFSVGLGVAQIVAPDHVASLIGAPTSTRTRRVMALCGVRELTSGAGILAKRRPASWLWYRVLGDVIDLALLGELLGSPKHRKARLLTATAAVAGVTLLDALTAIQVTRSSNARSSVASAEDEGIKVTRSITVNRPPEEAYRLWHNFENLPRFMAHLDSVEVQGTHSRWRAKAPLGLSVEWNAEILVDRENEAIAWRSLPGADVPNEGAVRFIPAPGGRGTEVHVELIYEPPAGSAGATFAKLFGEEPSQQIAGDLRRFKQLLETGEVVHSDASVHRGMHPARPSRKIATGELKS
jgi:uncharacterized membrane protein